MRHSIYKRGTNMTQVAHSEILDDVSQSSGRSFAVGPKGRVVLPASVRRAAGIAEGVELVAWADGDGRIVLETVAALKSRIWGAMPAANEREAEEDRRQRHEREIAVEESTRARRQTFSWASHHDVSDALVAYLHS